MNQKTKEIFLAILLALSSGCFWYFVKILLDAGNPDFEVVWLTICFVLFVYLVTFCAILIEDIIIFTVGWLISSLTYLFIIGFEPSAFTASAFLFFIVFLDYKRLNKSKKNMLTPNIWRMTRIIVPTTMTVICFALAIAIYIDSPVLLEYVDLLFGERYEKILQFVTETGILGFELPPEEIKIFVKEFLKPYEGFMPIAFVAATFLLLRIIAMPIGFILSAVISGIISLLLYAGVLKLKNESVERRFISL
ncbi:hypothetical protein ACFL3E_02090 [Patescibacteria group bacterium]